MATPEAFREEVFQDAEGNLFVFRDGDFQPTTRQALETGPAEAALVGAGEVFTNIARTFGAAGGAEARAEDERLLAPLQAEQPVAFGAGRVAPFALAGAATGGLGLAPTLAIEGTLGALEARPGERLQGAAFGAGGGALGFGVGKVAQRVLARRSGRVAGDILDEVDAADAILQAPTRAAREAAPGPKLTKGQRTAQAFDDIDTPRAPPGAAGSAGARATELHSVRVGQADDLGFTLSTGERLNSNTLRQIEAGFRASPFAPPKLREIKAANQVNLNQKWGQAIGAGDQVDNITDDVLGASAERIAGRFQDAADQAKGGVDVSRLADEVAAIRAPRGESLLQNETVDALLERIGALSAREQPLGKVAARDFMATRSALNKQMRQAAVQGDGLLTEALQDVIDAMDTVFESSAGPEAAAIARGAREQWRFLTALERGQTLNTATGNVNARTAGTSLRRIFKREAGRGSAEGLSDAGQTAIESTQVANYFGEIVGDSGTATRLSVQQLIQNPLGSAGGAVTRGLGEAYDRIIAPVIERVAQGGGTRGLDIGGGLGGGGTGGGPFAGTQPLGDL